jgi:AcrR family transcriptional regulator
MGRDAAAPKADRWQRRRDRTRRALMSAALDLFGDKGYDASTIEEITHAADVSPRTFFHHFASKEEVLFGGHRERRDDVLAALRSRIDTQPVASAVCDALLEVVDAFEADPAFFRRRAKLYASEPTLRSAVLRLNDRLIEDMTEVISERLGLAARTSLAPRLIATLANGALRSAIDTWVAAGGRNDLRTLAVHALTIVRPTIERAAKRAGDNEAAARLRRT